MQRSQPEVLFHLAAQPLVRQSYDDPVGTWATNVQGSLHVLETLKPLAHPCAGRADSKSVPGLLARAVSMG